MTDKDSSYPVEAIYRSLSGDIQKLLVCLAPFTGVANPDALEGYRRNLQNQPPLTRLPFNQWAAMLQQARERGLLRPHAADPGFIAIPSALTAILRHPQELVSRPDVRSAIVKAFYLTYRAGAKWMYKLLDSGVPAEVQKGDSLMYLEYENMRMAMELGLANRASIIAIYAAMNSYLMRAGRHQRGVELGGSILARLEQHGTANTHDGGDGARGGDLRHCRPPGNAGVP